MEIPKMQKEKHNLNESNLQQNVQFQKTQVPRDAKSISGSKDKYVCIEK